ncbi:glycosyltransferase family 2 protein [Corallococcus caeni]|uniref:glycosyltransferase family 2 protein n=1 Tax=Corallococcus caeni TaxID=3082388 RepID=UPI0030C782B9
MSTLFHTMPEGGQAAESAGELAERIAALRAEPSEANARELAVLTERLRRLVPPANTPLSPLLAAARLAVPFDFSVPPSHRASGGQWVTAAKRAFVMGLRPLHVELLKPQAAFNQRVLRVLERLEARRDQGTREDLTDWVRGQLDAQGGGHAAPAGAARGFAGGSSVGVAQTREGAQGFGGTASSGVAQTRDGARSVSEGSSEGVAQRRGDAQGFGGGSSAPASRAPHGTLDFVEVGAAGGPRERRKARGFAPVDMAWKLAWRAWRRAMRPVLEPLLERQAEWNARMRETLLSVAATPGSGTPDPLDATHRVARLVALASPLAQPGLPRGVRASAPLWSEVLRRQSRFNGEAVVALAAILGVRTPPPPVPALEDFHHWCTLRESGAIHAAREAVARLPRRPRLSLLVATAGACPAHLRECLASVEAQVYPEWELVLVGPEDGPALPEPWASSRRQPRIRRVTLSGPTDFARALRVGLQAASGDFVGVLGAEDTLAPHALAEVALALGATPGLDVVYGDEDRLDTRGRRTAPFFKPDWSPDLLRSVDYLGRGVMARRSLVESVGGFREGFPGAEEYDLFLRLSEATERIGHVPHLLYHRRLGTVGQVSQEGRRALAEHLARRGEDAEVTVPGPGRYRVRYAVRGTPKVSIIVPFKDRPDLLKTLTDTLLERTTYPHFELVLVSNNSVRPETFALLDTLNDPRVVKRTWDFPFNYPAINNWAAGQATGELLLFLNNDMEVVDPGWLTELVSQAQRPEVGAVGAKLLFPEGTVQHAGIVVGMTGMAGHPFWRLPDGPIVTPFGHTEWVRNWLSVTSACVMIRRPLFDALGGFDERFLLCGSDVDLGLRLHARGLRVVCTPFARVVHHESASRRTDAIPEPDYWRSFTSYRPWLLKGDPYYNPNLTLLSGDCDLRRHPEDGEALAVRTLAHEVPSARRPPT